jgi:hypothetical protein
MWDARMRLSQKLALRFGWPSSLEMLRVTFVRLLRSMNWDGVFSPYGNAPFEAARQQNPCYLNWSTGLKDSNPLGKLVWLNRDHCHHGLTVELPFKLIHALLCASIQNIAVKIQCQAIFNWVVHGIQDY